MSFVDPAALDLPALFRDVGMFESRRRWAAAGFHVLDRSDDGKIMVARHPSVQGLLFKKYTSDLSQKDQRRNYERRVEGSVRLRAFVGRRRMQHVLVPRKWLLELPRVFSRDETSYVLVVEQLDLLNDAQTKAAYYRISAECLKDLCVVLFHFRGMDSIAKNLPFVASGQIGFIDTEHWDRSTKKPYLHRVGEYLSRDRLSLAKKIFDKLEEGDDDFTDGAFRDDFGDEDTSDSSSRSDSFSDAFDDEEDTSASSSS